MRLKRTLWIVFAILAALQFVPANRDNPAVEQQVPAGENVITVLRESCYDCHSNETRWPWYARIAPVSFLLSYHVAEAREYLNFSTWNAYDRDELAHLYEEIREEIDEEKMPLPMYLWLHADAKLTETDQEVLRAWTNAAGISD